jgi:hypothetical protein
MGKVGTAVYQPPDVTRPHQQSENSSEWASIYAELRTKLPGEIVEIESARIRVEAVVAKLESGNAIRHLTITAKTPAQKEIVRYKLDVMGSSTLASDLATILSNAKDKSTPAEEVVLSISECLKHGGQYLINTVVPEPNPWLKRCMKRAIPKFEEFARNPLSMDMTFTLDRTVHDAHIRAVATLMPERRYTLVQTFTTPAGESSLPPSRTFKVRCANEFWQRPHSEGEIVTALHAATLEAMDTIMKRGAEKAARAFRNADIDDRLERGEINPANCLIYHELPSGARIMLEEGDSVACVRIEGSDAEESGSAFWRIASPLGPLLPHNPRLTSTESVMETLRAGDPEQKFEAIKILDRMANADAANLSSQGGLVRPFSALSLETLLGHDLAHALSRLKRCVVRSLPPTSHNAILDLLDGFQSAYLSHRDPGHSHGHPQDPQYLTFGFRNDGALKITLTNRLRNHLDIVVMSKYFDEHETRDQCVMRLARIFNKQPSERRNQDSFTRLRSEIEKLQESACREVVASQALRSSAAQFPSTANFSLNEALDTAAELALVYEADTLESISDFRVHFNYENLCIMTLENKQATPPVQMHLQVCAEGIRGIELLTLGAAPTHLHCFSFLTPISPLEGREVLSQLFTLFRKKPYTNASSARALAPSLTRTPLFRYLRECEERFAVVPEER